jgi:hypothetical protein
LYLTVALGFVCLEAKGAVDRGPLGLRARGRAWVAALSSSGGKPEQLSEL